MKNNVIEKAVEACGGRQEDLAVKLGVKQPLISKLLHSKRVPPGHCLNLHKITGIPLHEIRPDIYLPAIEQQAA